MSLSGSVYQLCPHRPAKTWSWKQTFLGPAVSGLLHVLVLLFTPPFHPFTQSVGSTFKFHRSSITLHFFHHHYPSVNCHPPWTLAFISGFISGLITHCPSTVCSSKSSQTDSFKTKFRSCHSIAYVASDVTQVWCALWAALLHEVLIHSAPPAGFLLSVQHTKSSSLCSDAA